jgi:putative membrane protein
MRFLGRLLLNGLALLVAAQLLHGIVLTGVVSTLVAALVLGFVNAIVRPVLFVLTLPFTILTLGLFIFVLNAICLMLTAALVPGFSVDGFGSALMGALIVTLVSWALSFLLVEEREER